MNIWRKAGRYCGLLLITGVLVLLSLWCYPGGGAGEGITRQAGSPLRMALQAGRERPAAPEEGPSGLFVLRLQEAGREAQLLSLDRLGVERGDFLDGNSLLLRLPLKRVAAVQDSLGVELLPYRPEQRLAPALQVRAMAATARSDRVRVEVTLFRPGDKGEVSSALAGLGGWALRGGDEPGRVLRVELPRSRLADLAGLPGVVYVEPVQEHRWLNQRASDLVAATPLRVPGWLQETGLSGKGQIIGLADSGLDKGSTDDIHPDLRSVPGQMPKVLLLKSWGGAPRAADPVGHGTHMAATIAGTGAASEGKFRGLAPGASLYFQGLLDSQGRLNPPPDPTTLFEPAYEAGVRVHVNGWGGGSGGYLTTASQIDRFIRLHPDFLAIFAAGNTGPGEGSLTPEAYTKNGLVVGASQSPHPVYDPEQTEATRITGFSSRGPTRDGRLKPELLAPGAAVSARSSLAAAGVNLNQYYTYMEGTSMAAAVAGGSVALLREYLQNSEKLKRPSAALLKAALICGARTPAGGPDRSTGFGVLDLGNTVLSLHQRTLRYVEAGQGVTTGQAASFSYKVSGGAAPFKVTLAWTDPEAAAGSQHPLVNNLDLVVRDPAGREWRGNSFLFPDQADAVNNVEEVFIPQPVAGNYTITVVGTRVSQGTVAGGGQDYALVYGQPLREAVAQAVQGNRITLAGGELLELQPEVVRLERDEQPMPWPPSPSGAESLTGAELYLPPDGGNAPGYAYVAGRTWVAGGVQLVKAAAGLFCTEIAAEERSGGYFLAPEGKASLRVNGRPLTDPEQLPPGSEVRGWVNPLSQELWGAEFGYRLQEGFLDRVDPDRHQLYLLGEANPYTLYPHVSLAYNDHLQGGDLADLPFGGGSPTGWKELLPGLRVRLMCSPTTGEVLYVAARRELVTGTVARLDAGERRLYFTNGESYTLAAGIAIRLDGKAAGLAELKPGYHVTGVLLPDSRVILGISADSRVVYGRLVSFSPQEQQLYLIDGGNNLRSYGFSGETRFYRWGIPVAAEAVDTGNWARLFLNPDGKIRRADLAETSPDQQEVVEGYDAGKGILATDRGSYRLSGITMVTKEGFPVAPDDLRKGEQVTLTRFLAEPSLLAAVAGQVAPGVAAPRLEVVAPWRDQTRVVVSGMTSGDRLYLYRPDGSRETLSPGKDGRFVCSLNLPPEGSGGGTLQLVVVDTTTGGVNGQVLSLPSTFPPTVFPDLAGHWAAADVEALRARGLLKGYPDGNFRPDLPITRAEFTVLLTGAAGWPELSTAPGFSDDGSIPPWARPAVAVARQRGLVHGYPDGRFLPGRSLTRAEAVVLLDGVLQAFGREPAGGALPWRDGGAIPVWARQAAGRVYQAGVMRGRPDLSFDPEATLTRAEMVAATCRLLEAVSSP